MPGSRPVAYPAAQQPLTGQGDEQRVADALGGAGEGVRAGENGPGRHGELQQARGQQAHARSGDPVAIAAYLGKNDKFDRSITDFSERYADQNERDYEAFAKAIGSGRIEASDAV